MDLKGFGNVKKRESVFIQKPEEQLEAICRGSVDLISKADLLKKLKKSFKEQKPLNIKAGFDPSRPDLHLGHAVLLNKLKLFQSFGHQVIFLIGDFTAQIGDPSGLDKTRPVLKESEVEKNAKTYSRQVFKILNEKKTKVCFNSIWMKKMSAQEIIHWAGKYTVARMLERDDFSKRFETKQAICIHELLYPLLQGYDSVFLKADVELGGTDQLFNLLVGRELQKKAGQELQCVLTVPLLEGLDGVKKMSKSYDNYIAIEDSPSEIFGKTMKLSDELMIRYYELLTDKKSQEMEQIKKDLKSGQAHPMKVKMDLAYFFVERFHGFHSAEKAKENFKNVFSFGKVPDDIRERKVAPAEDFWVCYLICKVGFSPSTSEARRLIQGGAVEINGEKIKDSNLKINLKLGDKFTLKAGKRRFVQIKVQT